MFRHFFLLALVSGLFSAFVSWTYASVYKNMIVDFSEASGFWHLLCFSLMITTGISILSVGISALVKNKALASFVSNFILSGISVSLVFYILKMNDPVFKNEDAAAMIDYFKGYLVPFAFIPALSWLSFKPLFIK
ncbi:hypothetical protein D3C87_196940 [compost metagenome]